MVVRTSITIPWVRRRGLSACIEAIVENAGVDPCGYEILEECDTARIGVSRMLQKLVARSRAQTVMFLADDCIPQPDFLKNALEAMDKLPDAWGLVGLNDGFQDGEKVASHFLADKRLLPLLGGEFFYSGYHHCCVDWELTRRCMELGRYIWARESRITHNHPGIKSIAAMRKDPDYRRVYFSSHFLIDHLTYFKRKLTGWR